MLGIQKRYLRWVTIVSGAVSLLGCGLAPTHYSPDAPSGSLPENWSFEIEAAERQLDLLGLLPNLSLESKLEPLINANPSYQRRLYQLLEVRALQGQSESALLPSLSLNADRDRNAGSSSKAKSQHSLRLSSRWELDIWGRLRDQAEAATLDHQVMSLDIEYAKRSLLADVIEQYLFLSNGVLALQLEERRLSSALKNEQLIHRRYQKGLGNLQDLNVAKTESFQRRAAKEVLLESQRRHIRELQRLFGDLSLDSSSVAPWQDILFPAVSIPSQALMMRPDLNAALKRVKAADLRSDVSFKQLLPSFTIDASVFSSQLKTSDLLSADPAWNLLAQLGQPIFQGGRIKSEIEAAQARAGQAYWSYKEALLNAFLEVDAALSIELSLAKQEKSLAKSLQHAKQSHAEYEQRYQRGLVSIFDVLNAQRSSFELEAQLLQLQLDRASNRLTLALAAGLPIRAQTI